MKNALTEAQIAAIAEGAVAAEGAAAASADATGAPAADAAPAAEGGAPAAGAEGGEPAAEATAAAAAAPSKDAVVTYLQSQLAAAQAQITDLTIQARDAKAAGDSLATSVTAMRAITVASIGRMRIALGHPAGSAESMSDSELLTAHDTLRSQFQEKFKAGGVAAVSVAPASDKGGNGAAVNPTRMARIAATRLK